MRLGEGVRLGGGGRLGGGVRLGEGGGWGEEGRWQLTVWIAHWVLQEGEGSRVLGSRGQGLRREPRGAMREAGLCSRNPEWN